MNMYMERTISSNLYMSIDLLSTTGFGVRTGTHGRVLGIGDITRVGGMYTAAGHMTGIGATAMHTITAITIARSAQVALSIVDIMSCIAE